MPENEQPYAEIGTTEWRVQEWMLRISKNLKEIEYLIEITKSDLSNLAKEFIELKKEKNTTNANH